MRSLQDFKEQLRKGYNEQRAKDQMFSGAIVSTPEAKMHLRKVGVIVFFFVAIPTTIVNYLSYQSTGRFMIILLAVNIVVPIASLWMMLTGKNPFKK